MKRVLALDWGRVRVGVALSDLMGMFAAPYDTFAAKPRAELLRRISKVIEEEEVNTVAVGLPMNMDGSEGESAKQARILAGEVEELGVKVVMIDERLSSFEAERKLREIGIQPSRDKGRVDRAAAAIMLQEFLDSKPEL